MDYTKILKTVHRINTTRLAMWVTLLAVIIVAGIAVLGAGHS
jgi:hypothetical protein